MSRTETALKPLVANNSSAAHRIASRRFGLRAAKSLLVDLLAIPICTNVQDFRSSQEKYLSVGTENSQIAAIYPIRQRRPRRSTLKGQSGRLPRVRRGVHMP